MSKPGAESRAVATPTRLARLRSLYGAAALGILVIALAGFVAGFLFGDDLSDRIGRDLGYIDAGEGRASSAAASFSDDVEMGVVWATVAAKLLLYPVAPFLLIVTALHFVPERGRRVCAVAFLAATLAVFAYLLL